MTPAIRSKIMSTAIEYGTGASTLRCLALATCDSPMNPNEMDLEESTKFVKYEQDLTFVGVVGKFVFFNSSKNTVGTSTYHGHTQGTTRNLQNLKKP